jgi:vitamin B12 transporter
MYSRASMQHRTLDLSLIALTVAVSGAYAREPALPELETTVVTATRTETPIGQVGSSITVITADDIADRHLNSVADALRVVPGLDVMRSGGPGQQTSVFLRGANSNHTLVLIDGIEMNDPGSPAGSFDFADLQVDQIERIEILRGGESSIYGSDAMGGVINIITKKGAGAPKWQAFGQGGAYDTFKAGGGVSGGTDRINYQLSASRFETGGVSAADKSLGNRERDDYENTTVTSRLGFAATEHLDFDWSLRFNQANAGLDKCNDRLCDDPNYRSSTEQLFTRGQGRLQLFDGLWEQKLGVAYSRTDRVLVNKVDPVQPFDKSHASYLGEKIKIDWQNNLRLHETNTLTFGMEDEEDRVYADYKSLSAFGPYNTAIDGKSMNTLGFYGQDQIRLGNRSFTTAAVRYDDNNRFEGKVTWRVTQAFAIDEIGTRIKGSYGTGFKAPTLYQLYAPLDFGSGFVIPSNPNLKPETSRNWDVGFEQNLWDERINFGATYFNNRFLRLIDFGSDFLKGLQNISSARSEGVETFAEFSPIRDLSLRGNYTYTRTDNEDTGLPLLRRPKHKGSFSANYRFLEKANLNLNVLLMGRRDDIANIGTRVMTPGYVLVNLAGSYDLTDKVQLYARLDNVFDKKYQEVYGYGTYGIAAYGGFAVNY